MQPNNAKCRDCEKGCWVPMTAWGRAARPKCVVCGGLLESTDDTLAKAADAKAARDERFRQQCNTKNPAGNRVTTKRGGRGRNKHS